MTSHPVLHIKGRILTGPAGPSGGSLPQGEPTEHGEAWVVDGRMTFRRPSGADEVVTITGWALPGLVDAHCHIGLDAHGAVDAGSAEKQAIINRDAGTLLIRDAGSPSDTHWIDARDDLPRIVRAGRHIARPRRYIRNYAHEVEPDQLAATVRQEARRGDGWVKLVGDWIDRERGDLAASWPREAAEAAIAAAHAEGARVTAHCFAEESLRDLAEAGIDCVEHATGLDEDTIPLFAERGVAIVPTLINIATFPRLATGGDTKYPQWAAHMRALHARRYTTVRSAYDAGIPIYLGTDAGGGIPHGLLAQEAAELVRAGIPAAYVVAAASWAGRAWLRQPALREGEPADLVVYREDPRGDIAVLGQPDRVVHAGRIVA